MGGVWAAEEFQRRAGAPPDAVASAPGRVNLIGEHLDYNGGQSLPIALTCRTTVAVGRAGGGGEVTSRQSAQGARAYVEGVLRALGLEAADWTVLVDGEVPVGSGLSSSAALECAVAVAAGAAAGLSLSRSEVVEACVRAENESAGAPTGALDQTIAMFASPGQALLLDFASGEQRPVPWDPPGQLLVIVTGVSHTHAGGEYADRRRTCEAAARELGVEHLALAPPSSVDALTDPVARRRARHVIAEQARVTAAVAAAEAGDWAGFGELMQESHVSLRDDYAVSCPELDVAVAAAVGAGAWGARMTGGGFGGSAIALCPPGVAGQVRAAVSAAYSQEGWRAPDFLDGHAGGPAELTPWGPGTGSASRGPTTSPG